MSSYSPGEDQSFEVAVGVYTGTPGNLQQVACGYSVPYNGSSRRLTGFNAAAGGAPPTYYIVFGVGFDFCRIGRSTPSRSTGRPWRDWVSVGGSLATFPDCLVDPNNQGEEECWARSSAATLLWAHGEPDYFYMVRDPGRFPSVARRPASCAACGWTASPPPRPTT